MIKDAFGSTQIRHTLRAAVITLAAMVAVPGVARADTGGYPYADQPTCANNQCTPDPWSFYYRECTSFVAWKMNQLGVAFHNYMNGPNGNSGHFGNASNWASNAGFIGYTVDNTPAVDAIAQWDSGHVAYVNTVNGDGTIFIEEYNRNYDGNYGTRTISASSPSHYIHVVDGGGGSSGSCAGLSNGHYCGGDNVSGDPSTLYSCSDGVLSPYQYCPSGCQVMPTGYNDYCL